MINKLKFFYLKRKYNINKINLNKFSELKVYDYNIKLGISDNNVFLIVNNQKKKINFSEIISDNINIKNQTVLYNINDLKKIEFNNNKIEFKLLLKNKYNLLNIEKIIGNSKYHIKYKDTIIILSINSRYENVIITIIKIFDNNILKIISIF
jgi:hypothetical protein